MESPKDTIPSLEDLFRDFDHPNPLINKMAYINMLKFWPTESMNLLLLNLDNSDLKLRRKSINALGIYGETILLKIFQIFCENKDKITRISCLKIILKVVINENMAVLPGNLVGIIELSIIDDSPEIILGLVLLLRQLGDQGIFYLLKMCNDSNVLRATSSITAISEMDCKEKIHTLLTQIINNDEKDILIINAAKEALNNI